MLVSKHFVSNKILYNMYIYISDPNDDAEVFSGPIDSNAGDSDYDYFGSIFPRPRVRVIVVPIAPDYSDSDDYDYPLPTFGHSPPSFNPLFHLLRKFFG